MRGTEHAQFSITGHDRIATPGFARTCAGDADVHRQLLGLLQSMQTSLSFFPVYAAAHPIEMLPTPISCVRAGSPSCGLGMGRKPLEAAGGTRGYGSRERETLVAVLAPFLTPPGKATKLHIS